MSGKKDLTPPRDLSALEDAYRIIGELSARDHLRAYLAARRSDGADVEILVADAPAGDAGNALTLFAADANLLATLEHRSLIPIHEGRWIGQDRFAVVTDRCSAPTLETLIARGERWSYPRIGAILHEVNGLLEWARQQKIVHRSLTLETVHLEPGTDRVLASFIVQPLTRQGAPGAEGDARTIATLAWSLITRGRDLPRTPEDSLGVVRPELPRPLVEATDALLHGRRIGDTEPPAPLDYIALVAMADAVMRGEVYAAELEATIYHDRLQEREEWAEQERQYQERLADQERQYQDQLAAQDQRIAGERDDLAALLASERAQMAAERTDLEQRVADERTLMERTLADERSTMERTLADERALMERTLGEERERMAAARAELERQIEQERAQLAALRAELEREVAAERDQLARERVAHADEIAEAQATMERTLADERAQMERHLLEERTRLETTLSTEQQRLLEDRTAAEEALARARAEFDAEVTARRTELESQLAREREAFEREVLAERAALEADKEGFAIYHTAERDAIAAERRALEELYLAYEAEGHVIEASDDVAIRESDLAAQDRVIPGIPAALADLAPIASARPVTEPAPDPTDPAETEAGLTRGDVKRSKRASWGVPASVILLIGMISATAVGIGVGGVSVRTADHDSPPRTVRVRATADPPTRSAARAPARPNAPTVLDSAGGAIVMPDSLTTPEPQRRRPTMPPATPSSRRVTADPPAPRRQQSPRRDIVEPPAPAAPVRARDTVVAPAPMRIDPILPTIPNEPPRDTVVLPTFPTTTPTPAPRDTTAPPAPSPTIPPVLPPVLPPRR